MFTQSVEVIASAIRDHWNVAQPISLHARFRRGLTADVWLVRGGDGSRYVAKFIYDDRAVAEAGLAAAEAIERSTGIRTGRPLRTRSGDITVMLPSVPGMSHPLAILDYVEGRPLTESTPLTPEPVADLLARVHHASAGLDVDAPSGLFDYLDDDSTPIAYAVELWPVIRRAAARARELSDLTRSICYGDSPEILAMPDHQLALIDWGCVMHAPVLWDVACWALEFPAEQTRTRFIECYGRLGPLTAAELGHVDAFVTLRWAQLLRFRAHRVHRADHYAGTAAADRAECKRLASHLGVSIP